jgi:microcystin-dependent protein
MSDPYVGEIRMVGFDFPPVDWAVCDGQLLPIAQYESLFQLIGTTYGGDGETTFALPDLRGRVAVHRGSGTVLAEVGGAEAVTVGASQVPAHAHELRATSAPATLDAPAASLPAVPELALYGASGPTAAMSPQMVSPSAGGGQPHDNVQPSLAVNFVICVVGIFPSQS